MEVVVGHKGPGGGGSRVCEVPGGEPLHPWLPHCTATCVL